MPGCCSTIVYPPVIRRLGRRRNSNGSGRHSPPIQILNDDVLLNIFDLYRLADPDQYDDGIATLYLWDRQRWWYKLAHVCRLWRNIILESPSRLDLHLYCTNGVPVADMLAHSPPLPLTIDYRASPIRDLAADDELGILLALSCRERVRRIRFSILSNIGKIFRVMGNQFPILERMYINSWTKMDLPVTFQAPNLRQLSLWGASIPIESPLLTTTAAGLVTLTLHDIPPSGLPDHILTCLSLMVHLEKLSFAFKSPPIPNRDVESQLYQTTRLPNLHQFVFEGPARYLEDIVARISAPSLSILRVYLFYQPSLTFPHLFQLMQTSENLRFRAVQVAFGALSVSLHAIPWKWDNSLVFRIKCRFLDWQVASAVQLFGTLSPVLSVVEQVAFTYKEHTRPELHSNVQRRQWRELLRPFTNAKTICVQDDLVNKIFRSLPSDNGEPPLELLPNLEEVRYSGECDAWDAFTTFLNERQLAGHPVSQRLVDQSTFNNPSVP